MVIPFSSPRGILFSGRGAAGVAPGDWHRKLRDVVLFCAILCLALAPGYAVTPQSTAKKTTSKAHKPVHHYAALPPSFHWRISRWTPMFPGSHELLVQQNQELDRTQAFRVVNDFDLVQHELSQELVPVNETEALKLADNLENNRRYCRPWTRDFLQDFSQAFYEQFHTPLTVNSLVRTMEQQHKLRRSNRFAAPE